MTTLQNSLASAERALAVLDEQPDVPEKAEARHLSRARGEIAFERVSFAYPDGAARAARRRVRGRAGHARRGIAGRTGSGKTTLWPC